MSIRLFLTLLFFLHYWGIKAQYNQVEIFDIRDGLAMTECGAVYCDNAGRIWTTHTNSMISCFDGRTFKRFTPNTTGFYSSGLKFAEDRMGMWVFHPSKSISLYKNEKWMYWKDPIFRYFCVDKASNQLVTLDTSGTIYLLDTMDMKWKAIAKAPTLPVGYEYNILSSLHNDLYLFQIVTPGPPWHPVNAFTCTSLINPIWNEHPELISTDLSWNIDNLIPDQLPYLNAEFPKLKVKDSYQIINYSNNHIILTQTNHSQFDQSYELNIYEPDANNQFQPAVRIKYPSRNAQVATDKAGQFWIASQAGLMRIHPGILRWAEDDENMVSALHVINEDDLGRIWFGGYETGLCFFDDENIQPATNEISHYKSFLPGSYKNENGNMAFWTEDYWMVTYQDGKWSDTKTSSRNPNREVGYYFLPMKNHQVAAGFQNLGLGIAKKPPSTDTEWKFINKDKGLLLNNVLTITEDFNGRLWTGRTSQGIAIYDPALDTARTWLINPDSLMNFGVSSSTLDPKGRLWLGCNDGIRIIENPDAFEMFKDDLTEVVQKIQMDEAGYSLVTFITPYQHYIVFGNLNGYGFIDLEDYKHHRKTPKIFFYYTEKFGGSCEQNAVMIDSKGFLWFGQDKGATRIDFSKFNFDTLSVKFIIDSLLAGSENIELQQEQNSSIITTLHRLPTLKRYVEIFLHPSFTGLLNDNVGFQYRLLHEKIQDTLWSDYKKTDKITFSYLPPGKTRIQIRAIKNNQTADEQEIDLNIPSTLSESPVFWIGSIGGLSILGALISFFFYRQRIRLKEAQVNLSEQRREKEQFQIRAIASSLNPHFIKNSLNWAQTRFRSDQKVATVIDELSSNISTIFKRSRDGQAFHSLQEEFELVKNYLSIQQTTYGQFLDITLPDQVLIEQFKNIFVPLLQIQIHVENAIEHGIRNRSGAHLLCIGLDDEREYLHLTVTDDGIGRKGAIELGSHGTQQGTMMLKSLHVIFNQYNKNKFSSSYEDLPLTDPISGIKVGTRVHIHIPKQYEYQTHENNTVLHT